MDEITILQAEVLKTLASPRRLEILHALAGGPMEVGRLAEAIGASQPNVSQHLAVLRSAGLVEAERDGPRGPLPAGRPRRDGRLRDHARRPRATPDATRRDRGPQRPTGPASPRHRRRPVAPLTALEVTRHGRAPEPGPLLRHRRQAPGRRGPRPPAPRPSASRSTSSCSTGRSTRSAPTGSPRPRARAGGRRGRPRRGRRPARAAGQASWAETLRQAKELGGVDIEACSLSMDLLHLEPDRPRPARRRRRGRDRLLPQRRRRPGRLHLAATKEASRWPSRDQLQRVDARGLSCPMPIVKTAQAIKTLESGRPGRGPRHRPGVGQGLRGLVADDRQRARRAVRRTAASTASSCDGSEAPAMTTTTLERPTDAADRSRSPPRSPTSRACPSPPSTPRSTGREDQGARHRQLVRRPRQGLAGPDPVLDGGRERRPLQGLRDVLGPAARSSRTRSGSSATTGCRRC